MLFRGYVALRFPTRDINSPAAAGVNCQEEGGNEAVVRRGRVRADPAIGTLRYLQWAALSSQPLTTSPSSMHLSGRLGQALVSCLPGGSWQHYTQTNMSYTNTEGRA